MNRKDYEDKRPIVAILQARMGSTRLPGKVMKDICGKPMLWHVVTRLLPSSLLDGIIVATSTHPEDDVIEAWCAEMGFSCFRGSEGDVLDRYYRAALEYNVKTVVRVCADCPLIDPDIVDMVIEEYLEGDYEHVGIEKSFPHGLDSEVFSFEVLKKAWLEAKLPSEREHVTPYIWKNDKLFKLGSVKHHEDFSHMRWTVDNERDFEFAKAVYEAMECRESVFGMHEVLALLTEKPEIGEINKGGVRGEGYLKSLKEDRESINRNSSK